MLGCVLIVSLLAGCGAKAPRDADPTSVAASAPSAEPTDPALVEAQQRADRWLATASVPPTATRVDGAKAAFISYQGWVCQPTIKKTGYWTIEGMSAIDVVNWMIDHLTPGLISNRTGPVDPAHFGGETLIGNVPHRGAFEGVVFSVIEMTDGGVAIRAEVGAEATDAICPTPPGGGMWGEPGMG